MSYTGTIERRPRVIPGKQIVNGSRMTAEFVKHKLIAGATVEQLRALYPHLRYSLVMAEEFDLAEVN